MQEIQKYNDYPYLLSRGGYDLLRKKLLDEKIKKRQHETMMTKNTAQIDDPHLLSQDTLNGSWHAQSDMSR